jgi:hypothetical protein
MAFGEVWAALQAEIRVWERIPNWTQTRGLTGKPFVVLEVQPTHITVDSPAAEHQQRAPRTDCVRVYTECARGRARAAMLDNEVEQG